MYIFVNQHKLGNTHNSLEKKKVRCRKSYVELCYKNVAQKLFIPKNCKAKRLLWIPYHIIGQNVSGIRYPSLSRDIELNVKYLDFLSIIQNK